MKRFLCLVAILAVVGSTSAFPAIRLPIEQESAEDESVISQTGFSAIPPVEQESAEDESIESQKDLDLRQGYNNYPGNIPVEGYPGDVGLPLDGNYPANQPGDFPVGQDDFQQGSLNAPLSALPGQLGGIGDDVPPHPLNSRPSYAYDSAYPDEVNFSLADPHRNVAAAVQADGFPQHALGGATELWPTGYQGKPAAGIPAGVSASAAVAVIKTPSAF